MVKLVIGIAGTIGAGKDSVADYLKDEYDFLEISIGDSIREEARELGMKETRENLQGLAEERISKFGEDYWIKKTADEVKKTGADFAVISGVRRPLDVIISRQTFGNKFKCIFVDADIRIRFERLKARKRASDPKNLDEFIEQEKNEQKQFNFEETRELADYAVNNDGSMEDLKKQLDMLMKKVLK